MATREELKQVFANGQMATGEKFANLIDSMKVVQLPVVDPQALGTSLTFIDSISQDADGKITATKKTLDLANAHELNPFKGWYKTGDTLPTDGFDGAYLYFKDTSELTGQTTIYRWNGTTYADTGTVVDTSNVQTFETGQAVNEVKIKDENGEEVTGPADVLSAEAGKELAMRSDMITLVGKGDEFAEALVYCLKNHTYRIIPNRTEVDFSGVSYSSVSYTLFSITTLDVDKQVSKNYINVLAVDKENYTLSGHYDVTPIEDGYIRVRIRCTQDERVDFHITELGDGYALEQFDKGNPIVYDAGIVRGLPYQNGVKLQLSATYFASYIGLTPTTTDDTHSRLYKIPLPVEASKISIIRINCMQSPSDATSYVSPSYLVDNNGKIVSAVIRFAGAQGFYAYFICPNSATELWYSADASGAYEITPEIVIYPIASITETLKVSKDATVGVCPMHILGANTYVTNEQLGNNIFNYCSIVKYSIFNNNWYMIPVIGRKYVTIKQSRTDASPRRGFAVLNKAGVIIDVVPNIIGHNYYYTYRIPADAAYIVTTYLDVLLPYDIYFSNGDESVFTAFPITFEKGVINGDGVGKTGNGNRLISSPISLADAFYFRVREGYRIMSAHLYDLKGNLVGVDFVPPSISEDMVSSGYYMYPYQFFGSKMYSTAYLLPQYTIRFEIAREDNAEISPDEDIVERLEFVSQSNLTLMMPDNVEKYQIMKKRLYSLFNCQWKALADIFPSTPTYNVGKNFEFIFFKEGRVRCGLPYSETSEYSKYVGQNVSFITFMTALLNKRSVMYTEKINKNETHYLDGNVSKYGLTYHGLSQRYAASYYGTVCTGLTGYVCGMKNLFISDDYEAIPAHIGLTRVTDASAANVKPMDLIWNNGHCSIISDIYKDRLGNVRYIAWAEQTKPTPYITLFTPNEFESRLQQASCKVYRYSGWDELEDDGQNTPFIQLENGDWPARLTIDPDITTFAGEYAVFSTSEDTDAENNNKAILNIHRGGSYTKLQIFAEDDAQLSSPTEYSLSDDNLWVSQSNIYAEDASDKEDWIFFDLKKITTLLSAGKYKARVSNADGSVVSGFTHWEMVDVSLSVAVGSGDITCTYSCSGNATPYLIRKERQDGMYDSGWASGASVADGYRILGDSDASPLVIPWSGFTTYNYIKLFVKADYGDVVVRKKITT